VWFLQWDQTTDIDPRILEDLKTNSKEAQTDKFYAYRNAGRVIERVLLSEYRVMGLKAFHIPREKVDHTKDPRQRQLMGVNGVVKPLTGDYSS
jgi:hypothetical protein